MKKIGMFLILVLISLVVGCSAPFVRLAPIHSGEEQPVTEVATKTSKPEKSPLDGDSFAPGLWVASHGTIVYDAETGAVNSTVNGYYISKKDLIEKRDGRVYFLMDSDVDSDVPCSCYVMEHDVVPRPWGTDWWDSIIRDDEFTISMYHNLLVATLTPDDLHMARRIILDVINTLPLDKLQEFAGNTTIKNKYFLGMVMLPLRVKDALLEYDRLKSNELVRENEEWWPPENAQNHQYKIEDGP